MEVAEEGDRGIRLPRAVAGRLEDRPRSSGMHYRRQSTSPRPRWRCLRGP